MENRKATVTFYKLGNNARRNSHTCTISIPQTWVDRMGLKPDRREVEIAFDGDRITIQNPEGSPIKQTPLANNKRIRTFALVWEQMYRNHTTIPHSFFEDMSFIGEGMADLGFVMDCGKSMKSTFPNVDVFNNNEALKQILEKVNLQTLGNAIFSQWRYWNHWSMEPMKETDYEWFAIVFSRLAELAE